MKILRYIGTFALFATLAACSTEDEQVRFAENEVKVNATIGDESIFTRSYPAGDAEKQKGFKELDRIGICLNGGDARLYEMKNGVWAIDADLEPLKWENGANEFKAFSPYAYGLKAYNSFDKGHIAEDQQSEDGLAFSDYMTASQPYSNIPEDRQLDLTFERKTARVIVDIEGSHFTNEFDSPLVTDVTISSQLEVPATSGGAVKEIKPYKMENSNPKSSWMALVAPNAEDASQNFICLKIQETKTTDAAKPYYVKGIPNLEAGKSYTYKLKIGKDKATIQSVTVENWKDGAAVTGGEAIAVSKEDVKSSIETQLAKGYNDIVLTLNSKPSSDVLTQIKSSLASKSGINLTLKGIETIPEGTFKDIKWLNKVTLPDAVTIGANAFQKSSLTDIYAPNVSKVKVRAFSGCEKLEGVNLPKVSEIRIAAFNSCSTLNAVLFGPLTNVWASTYYEGGIFDGVSTNQIILTLSTKQCLFQKWDEEGACVWKSTADPYEGSTEHVEKQFLGYTFAEIKCVDL